MAILIVTNRNLNAPRSNGVELFGERVNSLGASEIRLAWAEFKNNRWHVELIPEPEDMNETNRPSRLIFEACRHDLQRTGRSCVLYVHGFNKQFRETLEQARSIRDRYQVATVMFSWPSNPGGWNIMREYKKARAIARNSTVAFDRTLSLLGSYLQQGDLEDCEISFNMIVHSLGAYVFEDFVRDPIFTEQTRIFDNIVLHQADIDVTTHAQWVDQLRYSRRVYATINEQDKFLGLSDAISPDRLGNTLSSDRVERLRYIDFTNAEQIGNKHQLFERGASVNENVEQFFDRLFHGAQAEIGSGIVFDQEQQVFKVI